MHDIYWKSDTVGVEVNDVLPGVQFGNNTIAGIMDFTTSMTSVTM